MAKNISKIYSRKSTQFIIVILISTLTFLLLFTLRTASQTPDSLSYAYKAKTGIKMFHPHHLFYVPITHAIFLGLSYFCKSSDAILAGQIHNIIWAIITILSIYFIVRHLLSSNLWGLIASVSLLITQGFWIYSTQFEVYIPALGVLSIILAILIVRTDSKLSFKSVIIISLLLALSIFYHQTNILFCIPLIYYLMATQGKQRYKVLGAVLLITGLTVLGVYISVFLHTKARLGFNSFLHYCLTYTFAPDPDWGNWHNISLFGVANLIRSQLWNLIALPSNSSNVPLYVFGSILGGLFIWNIIKIYHHKIYQRIRSFLLIWIIIYFAFFLWWLPIEIEFFIITLLPIILLSFITINDVLIKLSHSRILKIISVSILAIFMLVAAKLNFARSFLPRHRYKCLAFNRALRINKIAPEECIIGTDNEGAKNLLYYCNRKVTLVMRNPLLYCYQSKIFPYSYKVYKKKCIFAYLKYVKPDYTVIRTKFNGYNYPLQWLEYIKWLFNVERDSNNNLITCRNFEIVATDRESLFIHLFPSKRKLGSLNNLFQIMDDQINNLTADQEKPFQKWLSVAEPNIKLQGDDTLF